MANIDDIKLYYTNILQREAGPGEAEGWEAPVNQGILTMDQVRSYFISSEEGEHAQAVVRLYQSAFGRVPDKQGLKDQVTSGLSIEDVAKGIAASPEFSNLYGIQPDATTLPDSYIASLYSNVLGRIPSGSEVAYWKSSGDDASTIMYKFSQSEEFQARSKAAVSTFLDNCGKGEEDYSGKLDDYGPQPEPEPEPVGETFTLTVGKDILVGTEKDDTFNADAYNPITGALATTLSPVDSLDGGEGSDTLNIGVVGANNATLVGAVKFIETVNIDNTDAASAAKHSSGSVDASKFQDVTEIWQISKAANVTKLASTTTAGFKDVATGSINVAAADAATSASIALSNVDESVTFAVSGAALNDVTVSGTRVDGDASKIVAALGLSVIAGKDVQSVSIASGVDTVLAVSNAAGSTKSITTVDAVNSGGSITYVGTDKVQSILTGSGADVVTIGTATVKDNAATTIDETVSASLMTGDGNDTITVATTGSGKTTVDAGLGNDTVKVTSRGTDVLTVNLGDGDDSFTSSVAIGAKDVIDAGAGTDTLLLSLVGSTNVGAFQNFDVLDTFKLGKELDTNILTAKNQVSEFVASGDVGTKASLTNVGADIGLRVSGDMGASNLSLTQKTAGAMTIRVDANEVDEVAVLGNDVNAGVNATNATSVKAIFDTAFTDKLVDLAALSTPANTVDLSITANAATSLEIESASAESLNGMKFYHSDKLTSATVYGSQDLTLDFEVIPVNNVPPPSKLASVDASGMTGALTFSLADLADKGSITLGSGADHITLGSASIGAGIESIEGFEKTAAVAVSAIPGDAVARAAAIADADILQLVNADFASAGSVTGGTIENGILSFTGTGPSTLDDAIIIANSAAETTGEATLFEYLGDSYVFKQDVTDTVVRLTGVVDVTHFAESATNGSFFIV